MKEELITVIIPVFNAEEHLEKCIKSVLNQTYKNIEVLLIDDGSDDKSKEICDNYQRKDFRIKVIHQENKGVAMARNRALEMSNGDFIGFVDSDDYIEQDMFELLHKNLKNSDADISICGYYNVKNGVISNSSKVNIYEIMNTEEAFIKIGTEGSLGVVLWNKLYRKKLFKNIQFPKGRVSEDWIVIYKLFDKAKRIVYDSTPKYYYNLREKSLTHKKDVNYDGIYASMEALELVKKKYPKAIPETEKMCVYAYIEVYNKTILYEKKYNKFDLKRYEKEIWKYYGKNKNIIRGRMEFKIKLIHYLPKMYSILIRLKNK